MSSLRRLVARAVTVVALGALAGLASAQIEIENNFKFNIGQDVQPIFEGWSHNPDGTYAMHFGYLNRNYVEEPAIPIGPNNSIDPGGPDRGQPTYFYPRTNRNLFTVTVPQDFGKQELVWTLTVNGKTEKAYGWLQPEWEIDPAGGAATGGRTDEEFQKNKAPVLTVGSDATVTLPATLTLTATVTDDGLPKPAAQRKAAVGQETPPLLQGGTDAPVNVPQVAGKGRDRSAGAGSGGAPPALTMKWVVWRGPASVAFEPQNVVVRDGKAQAIATFSQPGDYVLRATASDRWLSSQRDVRVTVSGHPASSQQ